MTTALKRRSGNGDVQWNVGNVTEHVITLLQGVVATPITDLPAALQYLLNSNLNIFMADLQGMEEARLTARVSVVGTAGSRVRLRYNTTFQTVVASTLPLGPNAAELEFGVAALGVADSGWIPIVSAARIPNAFLSLVTAGGDGVADPAICNLMLHLR